MEMLCIPMTQCAALASNCKKLRHCSAYIIVPIVRGTLLVCFTINVSVYSRTYNVSLVKRFEDALIVRLLGILGY